MESICPRRAVAVHCACWAVGGRGGHWEAIQAPIREACVDRAEGLLRLALEPLGHEATVFVGRLERFERLLCYGIFIFALTVRVACRGCAPALLPTVIGVTYAHEHDPTHSGTDGCGGRKAALSLGRWRRRGRAVRRRWRRRRRAGWHPGWRRRWCEVSL